MGWKKGAGTRTLYSGAGMGPVQLRGGGALTLRGRAGPFKGMVGGGGSINEENGYVCINISALLNFNVDGKTNVTFEKTGMLS